MVRNWLALGAAYRDNSTRSRAKLEKAMQRAILNGLIVSVCTLVAASSSALTLIGMWDGALHQADASDGVRTPLEGEWVGLTALAAGEGVLYWVDGDDLRSMSLEDHSVTELGTGWTGVIAMTVGPDGVLFLAREGELLRYNTADQTTTAVEVSLPPIRALAWSGDALIVQADNGVHRVDPAHATTYHLPVELPDARLLAASPTQIFLMSGEHLYGIDPSNGSSFVLGSQYEGVEAIAYADGQLAVVASGLLWIVNPADRGRRAIVEGWDGVTRLVAAP